MEITWTKKLDNFVEGSCERGKIYIRLNREKKVDSLYFCFEKTYKFLPEIEDDHSVDGMKERAQDELELMILSEEIADKLQNC